jgi:metal-dependent amidase/aminoacylase/carboxypeptidase family protein
MEAHTEICRSIDSYREKAVSLSHEIHERPELKFSEYFACERIARAIRDAGIEVEIGLGGLETSFRAAFGNRGPTIAILAEYDALPNGHSCGHNLIAGAALAAAVGLASMNQKLPGRIVLMGTPAEEGGGGKIVLLDKGAFNGIDAAIMAHPADCEYSAIPVLAMEVPAHHFSRPCSSCRGGALEWSERAVSGAADFPERRRGPAALA